MICTKKCNVLYLSLIIYITRACLTMVKIIEFNINHEINVLAYI